jgi:hypothetical protein
LPTVELKPVFDKLAYPKHNVIAGTSEDMWKKRVIPWISKEILEVVLNSSYEVNEDSHKRRITP